MYLHPEPRDAEHNSSVECYDMGVKKDVLYV